MLPMLGIIAGDGYLPIEIANIYSVQGGAYVIAQIEDEANLAKLVEHSHQSFAIGAVGKILDYFAKNKVEEVILIGKIKRPNLASIKVDLTGSALIAKLVKNQFLGDDAALRVVAKFIEDKGFKVISPESILKLSNYEVYFAKSNKPTSQDQQDIENGAKVLKTLGNLDIGQSVIVANNYVLGIEAAEGTDNLIRRCELLRNTDKGGVLVKMAKVSQDLRLDLPTIGPDTVYYLAKHGYNGVAIEKDKVIIANCEEVRRLIDEYEIFIDFI
jgi:UDP-2,3-diacylglucosamine hydrolase